MEDSVFTKIIKGDLPSYKLYEDDKTFAFLDITPVRYGHTLVVSKRQIEQCIDLPSDEYIALWQTVKKVATQLREVLGVERVAIKVIGVDVPHAHVHLIPFNTGENHYQDDTSPSPTPEEFNQLAQKLRL